MSEADQREIFYVDTPSKLGSVCQRLADSKWLAIDTEFIRERTYYPQLCLLQVANDDCIACVDPLGCDDLAPLLAIIYDPAVTKILHAAKQDLEIFYHLCEAVPSPIFDTQIAAALHCHQDQISYAGLVELLIGKRLDKGQTRTNWCQRPLEQQQLDYAVNDVRYLGQIYQIQKQQLTEQGRRQWLAADFAALTDMSRYAPQPQQVWRKIKDARRLKGQQLAVLQALAAWREHAAMTKNKPRRWLLRDELLLELSRRMPTDRAGLKKIRGLDEQALVRVERDCLAIINEAKQQPPASWPLLEQRPATTAAQEALLDVMMALVRQRAQQEGMSAATLATRKAMEMMLNNEQGGPLMQGWRRNVIGEFLQALLRGELTLRVEHGELSVREQ